MIKVRVDYYSLFREQAGKDNEFIETSARTPAELYQELGQRYTFSLPQERLRVAVNDEFSDWQLPLTEGATVVFLPPVAGG